jgi:hypothetical protein
MDRLRPVDEARAPGFTAGLIPRFLREKIEGSADTLRARHRPNSSPEMQEKPAKQPVENARATGR